MKKLLVPVLLALCIGLGLGWLIPSPLPRTDAPVFQSTAPTPGQQPEVSSPAVSPSLDTKSSGPLLRAAFTAVSALRTQNYAALSALVSPEKGLLFTPYATVEPKVNLCFTPEQVASFPSNGETYVWGMADGSGFPLEMTVEEYMARFVYDADFANAPILGVDRVLGLGNSLENVTEALPGTRFVEFYFPGIDPEFEGFDWRSLKLVFEPGPTEYQLVAVIHSEWTI